MHSRLDHRQYQREQDISTRVSFSVMNIMLFVLGLTMIYSFSAFMLIGLVLTVYWIPRSRDKNGQTLTLEELALGRAAIKSE
jgi:hypothetical protein